MSVRHFAARTSARLLLLELWKRHKALLPATTSTRDVLVAAPELIARDILGIQVVKAPSINGSAVLAGTLDRQNRKIELSTQFSFQSQRFTFAHELGHWVLHTGNEYFRDRSLSAPESSTQRPYYEIEADVFASELLMPRRHLLAVFEELFGAPIDGRSPSQALADAVSLGKQRAWHPTELSKAPPIERARAIAKAGFYKGRHFTPLAEYFQVSQTAMGIQLLDCGLLS